MGLDKWLKSENSRNDSKEKKVKSEEVRNSKEKHLKNGFDKDISTQLVKYNLICQNSKCKYQKIIMKKLLSEHDKKCPRCKKEMKIKRK